MSANWICAGAIAILTVFPVIGWAQNTQPPAASQPESLSSPRQDAEADKAMERPSGKAGREEPSSHTPTVPPLDSLVLVNGALAVPGAPANTDTVPAKFSAQNSADDRLITLAYTFKTLPNDQRQAIYQALKDQPVAGHAPAGHAPNVHAQVGTVLPFAVATKAVPAQLAEKVPAAKGYHYIVADNRVLLIAPASRAVVGVFAGTGEGTTGIGNERMR